MTEWVDEITTPLYTEGKRGIFKNKDRGGEGARGRKRRRINKEIKNKRMGSSRGKTLLRMTSAALDEILTDSKDESSG
jgi:hypothetical protein